MHPRYAIYYTPPPYSRLASFAAGVIGYDSCEAVEVRFAELPGIDSHVQKLMTVDPRRYGFHATLVAPFYLRERSQEEQLIAAANDFANITPPARIGSLTVAVLGDFIALVPVGSNAEISRLAASCLEAFDAYRAPLSAADRERRSRVGLTPRQIELMDRWGYPFVLDEYRFHMTLTGALPEHMRNDFRHALTRAFAERSRNTFELDAISVMKQDDATARFRVLRRCRLRG
jgi:putative phosphonate metabolism protein